MMLKKCLILILSTFLLIGCSNVTGEDSFSKSVQLMEEAIQEENWSTLEKLIEQLDDIYRKEEWKVQLLGDESEYETLQESINHLKVTIESQDILHTRLELSTIKTLIDLIYSL